MTQQAYIRCIASHLPEARLTNDELAGRFPDWSAQKILDKTGIRERRIAGANEFASDLAVAAAQKIFTAGIVQPSDVDVLVYCTQSPDYPLPSSSCLIQNRLGLPTASLVFDFSLGCSGFVYGLAIVKSLLESGMGTRALLLTADTYSKYIHPHDHTAATLFGDGATATLVELRDSTLPDPLVGPFVFGTDGKGGKNLIVASGGFREPGPIGDPARRQDPQCTHNKEFLYMNGPEIFTFTLLKVPAVAKDLFAKCSPRVRDGIDLYVFHQANLFMLEKLRAKMAIPPAKFVVELEDVGNTVSSTIPIALERAAIKGTLKPGTRSMLVGFGVGYSWAAGVIHWDENYKAI